MSLNMYLGEVQSQTQSMNAVCTATIQGMEQAIQSIDAFAIDTVLQGQTYDSAKAFFVQTFRPLAQGIIYLCEELIRQNDAFPSQFQSKVASTDVIEQEILEQIQEIDRMKASMEAIIQTIPIPGMDAMANLFTAMRKKLQEKLDHLYEFNQTSSNNYSTAIQLAASIATGLAEVQSGKGFSPVSGTFSTQGLNMEWTTSIQSITEERARQAENHLKSSSIEEGAMCGKLPEKSTFRKVIDGTIEGAGEAIGDTIEGFKALGKRETWENMGNAALHPIDTLSTMYNVVSDSFINDVINGDAESRAKWGSYALTQVAVGVIGDKGLSKASKLGKVTTKIAKDKIPEVISHTIGNLQMGDRFAFAGGNNIRSRFAIPDFKQTEEKLSTYQFANSGGRNHTPSLSNRQIMSSLRGTEKFTRRGLKHILEGEINGIGKAVGYHTEVLENTPGKIVAGTERTVNNQGVYKAKVEVNGVPKTANRGYSTFFPKDWSPQKIVDNINEAYNNKRLVIDNTYKGVGLDGIEIIMYIADNGKIISAFPKE
ncbi:EndoU domain-containing protein [Bacillus pseudomycoides]|uniref:EndoU domain-containing protein n=1 Tax=Bacillus pseudomycoides TaxID=64104 RepID=UPI000BF06E83|nr:EndoU domain-containing protein [Bacillus pseudomycoides]PEI46032.1 cytosolic protein [Bacillus pseudomycoides]PGA71720.1 cytosolic protein [Bacillus pseudomycoides]PHE22908.1 cytosolic protein [Bacillus pseudomycoides]PHE90511.1 cytosolic protein [Bacillus pseudomycoides]